VFQLRVPAQMPNQGRAIYALCHGEKCPYCRPSGGGFDGGVGGSPRSGEKNGRAVKARPGEVLGRRRLLDADVVGPVTQLGDIGGDIY
jgi:hypothetical protein